MRIVVCTLGLLMAAQMAVADVVVLRDQSRLTGTVTNREAMTRNPGSTRSVSILIAASVSDSSRLVRIPVTEIEYVVFANGSGSDFSVFVPAGPGSGSRTEQANRRAQPIPFSSIWGPDVPRPRASLLRDGGVVLTITGLVVFTSGLVGYAIGSAFEGTGDADLRGPRNLMLGGGAATVIGAIMISQAPRPNALRDQGAAQLYIGLTTRF